MIQAVYVTYSMKQSVEFIYSLASDLQKFGIKDIEHDREHNFIIVGDIKVKGISIYESYVTHGMNIKYSIDGIDMRRYKNATMEEIDRFSYHIREVMTHFDRDTKQLSGKDELIQILMGE